MDFWRNNPIIKTGLSCFFALLLCSQSFASPFIGVSGQEELKWNCAAGKIQHNTPCLIPTHNAQQGSESRDSTPVQHSHEKEVELEEKGEKEVEDDKEEMDRNSKSLGLAFLQTHTSNNQLAVVLCTGPILAVPTPPPNA